MKKVASSLVALLGAFAIDALGQRVPLPMERHAPVYDQFQQPLCRNAGDMVYVLAVGSGIQPPNPFNGEPHPDNTILMTTKVGAGINPRRLDCGFAVAITPRPDQPFFVRAYNAPSPAEATFYEDSNIFTPSLSVDAVFYPQMTATTNPINPAVSSDGMTVSIKQSLGLNPYADDTDGDGISDADEIRMGTIASDASSRMPPLFVYLDQDGKVNAYWDVSSADRIKLISAGLSEITQEEMADIFAGVMYRVEQSASLKDLADWIEVPGSHSSIANRWPPALDMPDMPEGVQFFRVIMHVQD